MHVRGGWAVLVESGFGLEPLAGEAEVGVVSGRCPHAAEGEVAGLPDHRAQIIRRKHRPPDVVGPDKIHLPRFNDGHNHPIRPDIFADQRAGAEAFVVVIFRNPVARRVMQGMYRLARLGQPPNDLLAKEIIFIFGLNHPVDRKEG